MGFEQNKTLTGSLSAPKNLSGNMSMTVKQLVTNGIYVGPGDMPEGYNIQIDPTGEETPIVEDVLINGVSVVDENGIANIPEISSGSNGIYIGDGEMPEDCVLKIDPNGEATPVVKDVTVGGSSVVQNGIADIPIVSESTNYIGLVKLYEPDYRNGNMGGALSWALSGPRKGCLTVNVATKQAIDKRWNYPIGGDMVAYAVKSAMTSTTDEEWTQQEQAMARARLGINEWEIIAEVTLEEEVNSVFIDIDKNGEPFKLKKVRVWCVFTQNQDNKSEWVRWHVNNNDIQFNIPNVLPSGNNKNTYVDVYMEKCDGYTDIKYFGPTTQTNDNRSYGQTIQHLTSFILLNNAPFENVTVKSNQPTVNIGVGTKILVMGVRE